MRIRLRMEGKEYLGYAKPKGKKFKQNQIRPPRSVKPTCTSSACAKTKKTMCENYLKKIGGVYLISSGLNLTGTKEKCFVVSHINIFYCSELDKK